MATIAFVVMTRPAIRNIGDWFLRNAYHEGGGTNVVNVILVDFPRSRHARRNHGAGDRGTERLCPAQAVPPRNRKHRHQQISEPLDLKDHMFIPAVLMQWMFPVMIMLAAYFFLRGHDLPGGGFSGGMTLWRSAFCCNTSPPVSARWRRG